MRVQLKEFQNEAVRGILSRIRRMQRDYDEDGTLSATCLMSPTGSGKTVMAAAVIEALFEGNAEYDQERDDLAVVLWLSESPSLNEQTKARFIEASDELADWVGDERHLETVDNKFCAAHTELDAHHVYFLSKNMLSTNGKLMRGDEDNAGRTFYDILDATIKDGSRHLYLFVDEAHRGLGSSAAKADDRSTIYTNLIDGADGRPPVPIVVGLSATPQRFEVAMSQRANRDVKSTVVVPPTEVQDSGLLKDKVTLKVPQEDVVVEHQYLDLACERFDEAVREWASYCAEQAIMPVTPLLLIQTRDLVGPERIGAICQQISSKVPGLNRQISFAHVFGDRSTISSGGFFVRYVPPEEVQGETTIRVLFAKEAISNGWDCPRAEVIYSERRRTDVTYIAQLVGRMVRTPLARRIGGNDLLNSVACYLPNFDRETTEAVVAYITGEKADIGVGVGVREAVIDPVIVSWAEPKDEEDYAAELAEAEARWAAEEAERARLASEAAAAVRAAAAPVPVADEPRKQEGSGLAIEDGFLQMTGQPSLFDFASGHDGQGPSSLSDGDERLATTDKSAEQPEQPVVDTTYFSAPAPKPKPKTPTKRDSSFTKEVWAEIQATYCGIPVRRPHSRPRNEFKSLLDTATLLMDTKFDPGAGTDVNSDFCHRLEYETTHFEDEFRATRSKIEVSRMWVVDIDMIAAAEGTPSDEAVTWDADAPKTDSVGLRDAAQQANKAFSNEFAKAYAAYLAIKRHMGEDEVNLNLAACAMTPAIVHAMQDWAADSRTSYLDKHAANRDYMDDEYQQLFDELESVTQVNRVRNLDFPPRHLETSGSAEKFERHIVQGEDGLCPLKLMPFETFVLKQELARPMTVAFYRNQTNRQPYCFGIPYKKSDGIHMGHPDFVFFVRDSHGDMRPAIVDPHGAHHADAVERLKGYVTYLQEFPNAFIQALSVSGISGTKEARFLDLLKPDVQKAILDYSGSQAEELFRDTAISHHYATHEGRDWSVSD